ncbi:MAG: hypothetical protein A4S09_05885 [Proteobacteria bacterium SG_bin7]|nr:MAG: hypothetical protein A4S09_05885 [Proteobacteria bacterium SG_bin7]
MAFLLECKATLKLALPIAIGLLAQMAMGLIDSIMVGRLGAAHLAAGTFANGVITIMMVFGIGSSNVVGPILSHMHGAGKEEECGARLLQSILLYLSLGLTLSIFAEIISYFLEIFNQPEEVTILARDFFRLMGLSLPMAFVFNVYKQFVESYGKTGFPMLLYLVALGINTFINWFLIYGNGPFPKMGLLGAGIGTIIARFFMLAAIIYHVHKRSKFKKALTSFKLENVNKEKCFEVLRVGIPSGMQVLFEVGAFVMGGIMMGWLGTNQLAAHQIAIGIASMTFMYALGVSLAGGLRVGVAKGKGDQQGVRRAGFAAIIIIAVSMAIFGLIMLIFRKQIPYIYLNDPEVVSLASKLLLFAVFFQVFDGVQAVAIGLLRGVMDLRFPTVITVFSYGCVCVPFAYIFGFHTKRGAEGIWLGLTLGLIVASILLFWRFDWVTKNKIT